MILDNNSFLGLFGGLFILGIFVFGIVLFFTKVRYRRRFLQTEGELRFFKILKIALEDKYDIFAQVRLASLVEIPNKFFLWRDFNPLGAKCVDYVICDKKTGRTLVVLELDDKSHRLADRKRRDKFVNNVLKIAKIPILHFHYHGVYNKNYIRGRIEKCIIG